MPATTANRQRRVAVPTARLRDAARRALRAVGRPGAAVEILVADDAEMRRVNGAFRGVRRRTDVLAFPMEDPATGSLLLGQVVISAEAARRQSRQLGVPLGLELELLLTHGVLHLVGYDDRDPVEADLMHRREREILESGRAPVPERLWTGLLR